MPQTVKQKFIKYQNLGYVFHGSNNPNITKLKSRPAKDINPKERFNNDTAVFASRSPAASIIFACMSLDKVPKEIGNGIWSVGSEDGKKIVAKIPQKWKKYIINNTGYVYVLDSSSFFDENSAKISWQVKSKQPVKPIAVISVSFSDFEKLGGSIIWKEED